MNLRLQIIDHLNNFYPFFKEDILHKIADSMNCCGDQVKSCSHEEQKNIFYRLVKNDSSSKLKEIKLGEKECLAATNNILLMEHVKVSPYTTKMKKNLERVKIENKRNLYAALSMFVDVLFIAQTFSLFHGQFYCSTYNVEWMVGKKIMSVFYNQVDYVELNAKLISDLTREQNITFVHKILNKYTPAIMMLAPDQFTPTRTFIHKLNSDLEKGFVASLEDSAELKEINRWSIDCMIQIYVIGVFIKY